MPRIAVICHQSASKGSGLVIKLVMANHAAQLTSQSAQQQITLDAPLRKGTYYPSFWYAELSKTDTIPAFM